MTNRLTSRYALTIPRPAGTTKEVWAYIDQLQAYIDQEPDTIREGTGFSPQGDIQLLYRVTDDDLAISIARAIGADTPGTTIAVNLGVHRRIVKEFK